ncbi:hypothetical protein [Brevibacterium iodinum]|uniref:hypothetical protein n=2 Tax=Brevibacterium iodinum TaxID=31943 RepID=UPI0030B84B96
MPMCPRKSRTKRMSSSASPQPTSKRLQPASTNQPASTPAAEPGRDPATDSDSPAFTAAPRVPTAKALRPASKTKTARAKGSDRIQFGRDFIDLIAIAQLVDTQQASGVAEALEYLAEIFDGRISLTEALAEVEDMLDAEGLDGITGHRDHPGHLTRPRRQEIAAALNRYRGLSLER